MFIEEKIYRLKNLRIKELYGIRYLNIFKLEYFEFEEIFVFIQSLVVVVIDIEFLLQVKMLVKIIGV